MLTISIIAAVICGGLNVYLEDISTNAKERDRAAPWGVATAALVAAVIIQTAIERM